MGEIDDDPRQSDIRDVLQEVQQTGGAGIDIGGRIRLLLKHFASRGYTLAKLTGRQYLGRSERTLQGYAREAGVRFPDYVPYALRTDEERKRGSRTK